MNWSRRVNPLCGLVHDERNICPVRDGNAESNTGGYAREGRCGKRRTIFSNGNNEHAFFPPYSPGRSSSTYVRPVYGRLRAPHVPRRFPYVSISPRAPIKNQFPNGIIDGRRIKHDGRSSFPTLPAGYLFYIIGARGGNALFVIRADIDETDVTLIVPRVSKTTTLNRGTFHRHTSPITGTFACFSFDNLRLERRTAIVRRQ